MREYLSPAASGWKTTRRDALAAGGAALAVGIGGCLGSGSGSTVRMNDMAFTPVRLSVEVDTTVTWQSDSTSDHVIESRQYHERAADWEMAETLPAEGTISRHFGTTGIFEYACGDHDDGQECGAILVGDTELDARLPCDSQAYR